MQIVQEIMLRLTKEKKKIDRKKLKSVDLALKYQKKCVCKYIFQFINNYRKIY